MRYFEVLKKIRARIRKTLVDRTKSKSFYPKFYWAYWHYFIFGGNSKSSFEINFLAGVPNRSAGIGHQLANWIAGYWFAKLFNLNFAHVPFQSKKWEYFLGLGQDEVLVDDLINNRDFQTVRLPMFDENNFHSLELIRKIIQSYSSRKVVFILEQDQFYKDQYGNIGELKRKFFNAKCRTNENLKYSNNFFNIAIHVRRGDIVIGQQNQSHNLLMRWQDNSYFEKVLNKVVENLRVEKPIAIYLFSQGEIHDFPEFSKFNNIHFCLDMDVQESFLHMVYADLLITSKSSFSYKPALLNNGIKICPERFWHNYPKTDDWILVDDNANFDTNKLLNYE
ncbi:hypothetical protein [Pedobacter sp. MC2016-24]|uniref:hypothetical protein n=1 Tax=Pedobacter sp. MC2016-24 TaxID=2780090 RepID=UPI00187EC193|nr:hypothetical protein [Pedobacter sp. MC2016-24]MBE9599520.1 hypothetical protein [Pedobacter sp. MC2016-24]